MPIYEPLSWMHVLWRPHTIIKMTRLHNPNAYVARGNDYFFTPKTFGGDKEKAVDTWKKAIAIRADFRRGRNRSYLACKSLPIPWKKRECDNRDQRSSK
jgi:hypothetical protein